MSPDTTAAEAARQIAQRAQALGARRLAEGPPDPDAELLAGLASGTLVLADADDEALERAVKRFGIEALARALLSAHDLPELVTVRPIEPPRASAAAATPDRVVRLEPRRPAVWRRSPWLAVAALVVLATTALFMTPNWLQRAPRQTGGAAPQSDQLEPRLQTPTNRQGGPATSGAGAAGTVAVVIGGDDGAAASRVESALSEAMVAATSLVPLEAAHLSVLRQNAGAIRSALDGDVGALAESARESGVELIVVGTLTCEPADGKAGAQTTLRVTSYRVPSGQSFVNAARASALPQVAPREGCERAGTVLARAAAAAVSAWMHGSAQN